MIIPIAVPSSTDDLPRGCSEPQLVTPGWCNRVVPSDSPAGVFSFLHRMERTGLRTGTLRNGRFLAAKNPMLVPAAGLIDHCGEGYVEPIVPPPLPYGRGSWVLWWLRCDRPLPDGRGS